MGKVVELRYVRDGEIIYPDDDNSQTEALKEILEGLKQLREEGYTRDCIESLEFSTILDGEMEAPDVTFMECSGIVGRDPLPQMSTPISIHRVVRFFLDVDIDPDCTSLPTYNKFDFNVILNLSLYDYKEDLVNEIKLEKYLGYEFPSDISDTIERWEVGHAYCVMGVIPPSSYSYRFKIRCFEENGINVRWKLKCKCQIVKMGVEV